MARTTHQDHLEAHLLGLLQAVSQFGAPALACGFTAAGAQAAWWLIPDAAGWIAPVATVAAVAWFAAGASWAWRRCPIRPGLRSLLAALHEATGVGMPSPRAATVAAALLLVGLAAPAWISLVLWNVVLLIAREYRRSGVRLLHLLGATLAAAGLGLVAAAFLFENAGRWIAPAFALLLVAQWFGCVVATVVRRRRDQGGLFPLLWLLPAALPLLLPLVADLVTLVFLIVFAVAIWPAVVLGCCELAHSRALGLAQQLLAEKEAKDALGRPPLVPEDELRESDGYCQLHYPEYRHWIPRLAGECGYLAWFKPAQECVAFRATSLFPNPSVEHPDGVGRALASLARDLLPDLGLSRIEHLNKAFQQGWNVARLDTRETPLAKMPWDHPFLLTLPVNWIGTFVYPPGSGIHDRDEFPCVVKKASVRIRLRDPILAAASRLGEGEGVADDEPYDEEYGGQQDGGGGRVESSADAELCRKLLWNAWRILPGAYESLLTTLVTLFRDHSVALFMEHDEGPLEGATRELPAESKSQFVERLNAAWSAALPAPLNELIDVAVLDLHVDTYLVGDVRKQIFALRVLEANRPLRLQESIKSVCQWIENLFTTGAEDGAIVERRDGSSVQGDAPAGLKMIHDLQAAKRKILETAGESRDNVLTRLGKMEDGAPRDAFPVAQRNVTEGHDRFVRDVDQKFKEISERLREVVRIYGERTW